MKNTTASVKSISERKQALEAELKRLEAYEGVQAEIDEMIEELKRRDHGYHIKTRKVGIETEQARDYHNELLWEVPNDWHHYTEATIKEKGLDFSAATPYYRDIYEDYTVEDSELYDWEMEKVTQLRIIRDYLLKWSETV